MPTVAHSTLTGAELHEPKGADSAASSTVYVANGTGSGSFQKLPQIALSGISTAQGEGKFVATNNSGGFQLLSAAHGSIYHYSVPTATQNGALIVSTGRKIDVTTTAKGTPVLFTEGTNGRLTYTGTDTIDIDIVYNICFDTSTSNATNALFYIKKNTTPQTGSYSYVTSKTGEIAQASNHADITMNNGDYVELWAASDSGDYFFLNVYTMSIVATTAGA